MTPPVFIKPSLYDPCSKVEVAAEQPVSAATFRRYDFTGRRSPSPADSTVFANFSEFGCEMLGVLYCMPRLLASTNTPFTAVAGWRGRHHLYRHLVDQFWELEDGLQNLRDRSRAFHHDSPTLRSIESSLGHYGKVVAADSMSMLAIGCLCPSCGHAWSVSERPYQPRCPECFKVGVIRPLLEDMRAVKRTAVRLPGPSLPLLRQARSYLGDNPVGIFARNRACYGRNLPSSFYVRLIAILRGGGYTPIWMGEPQSTLPCPVPDVLDFSRLPESRDLSLTLAIVRLLRFTVQFWTASTRLAGLVGTPYVLFESPDQIVGDGHEGRRLYLTTFGPSKIVYSHFLNVAADHDRAMEVCQEVFGQVERADWSDVIGLVDNPEVVQEQVMRAVAEGRRIVD